MDDRSVQDTAQLVAGAREGDRHAFAELVRRYQDYAYGVAAGLLGDPELGRDVVQEAFVIAHQELPKLREPGRFGGWLRGIVRHTSLRALREIERARQLTEELARPGDQPEPVSRPDEGLLADERRAIVRHAMARLSERHREAVGLHYMDGLSYAQIAGFLGTTETAVQGRLQRARAQLREELEMVEETYAGQKLPDDFAVEVDRLLQELATDAIRKDSATDRLVEIGSAAVDPLCEALQDPNAAVRQVALRALCYIGDERARRPVLRLLYARNAWKRWHLTEPGGREGGILNVPGVREALIQEIRDGLYLPPPDKSARLSPVSNPPIMAVHVLSQVRGDPEVITLLEEVTGHPACPHLLWQASFRGLCQLQPESAARRVAEVLRDDGDRPPGKTRRRRDRAVGYAHEVQLAPPLDACLQALAGPAFLGTRIGAAQLCLHHGSEGEAALREALNGQLGDVRHAAAIALGQQGDVEALTVLRNELLATRDQWKAETMADAIVRHDSDAVRELIAGADGAEACLPTLMWSLARSRERPDAELMASLAREGTPAIRAAAVRALSQCRGAEYLPHLRQVLAEGQPRKVAQEAFRQMQSLGDEAEPTARDMLASERWTERKAGVCLLQRWGKLSELERTTAREDEHIAVRHAVGAV